MYTQILSKNELVINEKEQKGEEEEGKKRKHTHTKNGHGKHGEKKGKTGGTILNYQQIPLPCLRNKTKARQKINENNREKSKQKLGWPVHQRIVQCVEKNSGTSWSSSQFVPNMLFSISEH